MKIAKIFLQVAFTIVMMVASYVIADILLLNFLDLESGVLWLSTIVAVVVIVGIFSFLFAPWLIKKIEFYANRVSSYVIKIPFQDIVGGTIGLIIGLLIATLLGSSVSNLAFGPYIVLFFSLFMGYLGLIVGIKKKDDILVFFPKRVNSRSSGDDKSSEMGAKPKVLDTSVIIDGRIADIYKTGFIEGNLIIPFFVLDELKHIADSSDPLKKNRGRRGMDILNRLQEDFTDQVIVMKRDYREISEVDSKLVRLAADIKGDILTNDFNLNKMAQVQGILVLNINELSNAVKTVVLPGEEMSVKVIKEGKENQQGIAYLDDGTMIVVEDGKKLVGYNLSVVVTSVLQTSAGRMIFARPKITEY